MCDFEQTSEPKVVPQAYICLRFMCLRLAAHWQTDCRTNCSQSTFTRWRLLYGNVIPGHSLRYPDAPKESCHDPGGHADAGLGKKRFNSDPSVIGKQVKMYGHSVT